VTAYGAPVRRLGPADHASCVALCLDRSWSPEGRKWSLLLAECDPFGIDAPDGDGLAGAVVLTRYGGGLAAIGMTLVAARYGGMGLGRALMEHALKAAGRATVVLTATRMGRPLYEKLGFAPVRQSATFRGEYTTDPGPVLVARKATTDDLPAVLQADESAFGGDRGFLLRRMPDTRVLPDGTGYAAASPGEEYTTIGPVVARSIADARTLIASLAASMTGPIRIDTDPDRPGLPGWLTSRGLPMTGQTTFMVRGPWPVGSPDLLHALLNPALG
jgi:GNAT superfamily N-acetyltransferase